MQLMMMKDINNKYDTIEVKPQNTMEVHKH